MTLEKAEMRRSAAIWGLAILCLLALPPGGAAVAARGQPTSAAQDEFVPLDSLPPDEGLPAAPLVMAAYGAAWLIIVLYLWSIWRRLGRVERELADVARRTDPTLSTGSHRQDPAGSLTSRVSERDGLVTPKPRSGDADGLVTPKPRSGEGG